MIPKSLRMFERSLLGGILVAVSACISFAGPLQQAEIHRIINDVRLVNPRNASAQPAKLRDIIKDDLAVRTGVQSRAELLFQDDTLTRLGADALFSFKAGTRDMVLDRGTMLLQVPKGLGGARIQTAAVTAAITGTTIMMENIPGDHVKVLVLEGSLRLSMNGRWGESVVLTPGKMVIVGVKDRNMPKPVSVDLAKLVKTSALIDPEKFRGSAKMNIEPLPSMGLIEKEIAIQTRAKSKSRLAETNLLIQGDGTQVVVANKETMAALEAATADSEVLPALLPRQDRAKASDPLPATSPKLTTAETPLPSTNDLGVNIPIIVEPGPPSLEVPGATTPPPPVVDSPIIVPPVDPTVIVPPVDPTVIVPPVDPTVIVPPVDPTVIVPPVDPTVIVPPVDPTVIVPPVDPTVIVPPVDPTVIVPPVDPTVIVPPVDPTVIVPPVDPTVIVPTVDPVVIPIPTTPTVEVVTPLIPAMDTTATLPSGGTPIIPLHSLTTYGSPNLVKATVTTGGANPVLNAFPKQGALTAIGAVYAGTAIDGVASKFLFGSTSLLDAQLKFDSRFGVNLEPSFPTAGIATFRFASFNFDGAIPFTTTGGPLDVALIGNTGIGTAGQSSALAVGGLRSLFVGTNSGSITLTSAVSSVSFTAPSTSGFRFLHLYARGATSNLTIGGAITTPGADLFGDAGSNVVFSLGSTVSVNRAVLNAANNTQLLGNFTGNQIQVWSGAQTTLGGTVNAGTFTSLGNSLAVNGSLTANKVSIDLTGSLLAGGANSVINAPDVSIKTGGTLTLNASKTTQTRFNLTGATNFRAAAPAITMISDFAVPSGATSVLEAGLGGLNSTAYNLTGLTGVTVNGGNVTVKNLDAKFINLTTGNLTVSGSLTTDHAVAGGNVSVTGAISPRLEDPVSSLRVLNAASITAGGGLNYRGADSGPLLSTPGSGYRLALLSSGNVTFGALAINGGNFDGGNASLLSLTEGGDGGTLHVGTDAQPVVGDVTVSKAISATSGSNSTGLTTGGKGGTVNVTTNGTVTVNSSIKVSDTAVGKASRQGGNIRLESRKLTGTAISVQNSGQLLSLLSAAAPGPGGKVEFVSAGGDISVNGGTLQADKGSVSIVNNGAGNITLTNATLRGDVVKANVLGANGQLIIAGGTIDANSAIKLYANGSNGSVIFKENTSLNGNSVKTIAGNTVQIDNGKVVTVNGPSAVNVHTDNANYTGSGGNNSSTGTFGGKGATTSTFSSRPGF